MGTKKPPFDHELIRELAKLLDDTALTEIEIEQSGVRVRVARQTQLTHLAPQSAAPVLPIASVGTVSAAPADYTKHPGLIASPMVGTAYRAPQPGDKPFVEVGSAVKAGETLLIIEAMKTMNQIPAPRAGIVIQILFEDGQPVEYGEPLMIIE